MNADSAFITTRNLGRILLKSPQRCDLALEDHDVIPQQANLGSTGNFAVGDVATRNGSDLRNFEHVANVRGAEIRLFEDGFQDTQHRAFDLVDDVIDDRMEADIY